MGLLPKQYNVSPEFSRHQDSLIGYDKKIAKVNRDLEAKISSLESKIDLLERRILKLESA